MSDQLTKKYTIDGQVKFNVVEGEIFGIGGETNFVKSLYSAVKMLEDPAVKSVNLESGHVIGRG